MHTACGHDRLGAQLGEEDGGRVVVRRGRGVERARAFIIGGA